MNFDKLNGLVRIAKKSEASKNVKKEYKAEIAELLDKEGISANAEKYIWAGFSFCGAQPIFDYLNNKPTEDQLKFLNELFKTKTFIKNEKSNGFKMCISLLSCELNFAPNNLEVIELLIKQCVAKYKKSDKTISKDNNKLFERFFVATLIPKAVFPSWNSLKLTSGIVKEFCSYLLSVCSEINNEKFQPQILGITGWLNSANSMDEKNNTVIASEKKTIADSTAKPELNSDEVTASKNTKAEETPKNDAAVSQQNETIASKTDHVKQSEDNIVAESKPMTSLFGLAGQLKELAYQLTLAAEENAKMKKAFYALKTEKSDLIGKVSERDELIEQLQNQLSTAESELVVKTSEIIEYKAEIDRLKTVISVYSEDKQSSMDGQLNAIAAKLKAEYQEYRDSLEYEMSAEIGEMLRDQLARIFKILMKAGINIGGK